MTNNKNNTNSTCENCQMRCCPIRYLDKKCENFTLYNWRDNLRS